MSKSSVQVSTLFDQAIAGLLLLKVHKEIVYDLLVGRLPDCFQQMFHHADTTIFSCYDLNVA